MNGEEKTFIAEMKVRRKDFYCRNEGDKINQLV